MDNSRAEHGLPLRVMIPALLVGCAAIVRQAARPLSDTDAFWHLRLGEMVAATGSVHRPTENWTSSSDAHWVMTQWLPEVVTWLLYSWIGYPGLAVALGTTLVAIAASIYVTTRGWAGVLASGLATITAIMMMSASLSPRPHLITYLLLAVTVHAWSRTRATMRAPWWLIPVTWVWAMSHGMWFLGPMTGAGLVIALTIDIKPGRATAWRWIAVPALSVAAACLTPVGPRLLGAPFAVAGIGDFISEWQPPNFQSVVPALGAAVVALIAVSWARSSASIPWFDVSLLAMGGGWLLVATRTEAIAAVLLAPLLASTLQRTLGRDREEPRAAEAGALLGGCAVLLVALAIAAPRVADHPELVSGEIDAALVSLPDGARVLNDYAVGGWLHWEHPNLDPTIDGLTEAYSVHHLQEYGQLMAVAGGWQGVLVEWDPAAAVLPTGSPLATALTERLTWVTVAQDDSYVVLLPPHD